MNTAYRKTSFHRDKPGRSSAVGSSDPICVAFARRTWSGYDQERHNHARTAQTLPSALQAYPFFTMSIKPPDCGLAEPLSLRGLDVASARSRSGGARRDRTDDLLLAKQALSQLSYGPVSTSRPCGRHLPGGDLREKLIEAPATKGMVGLERFELSTSRLSSARSNQLSYRPGKRGRRPNEERETKAAVSRMHSKNRSDS